MKLKVKRHRIVIEDTVFCRLTKELKLLVKDLFIYDKEYWREAEDGYGKDVQYGKGYYFGRSQMSLNSNLVRIGNLPRIKKHCKQNRIPTKTVYKMNEELFHCDPVNEPKLKGIDFRADQLEAINASKKHNFGRIVGPTGSGKTVTLLGICSMYSNENILILAHTKDLVGQLYSEAQKYQLSLSQVVHPIGSRQLTSEIAKLNNDHKINKIIITTVQSLARVDATLFFSTFDIIIVDEVHHVVRPNSQYGYILDNALPAKRYGFTATVPTKKPDCYYNEGLFGPVIAELTIEQALQKGIVAMPSVTLLNVPYNARINQICGFNYKNIYRQGLVENTDRNLLIANQVKLSMAFNHSTLIIVEKIEHGKLIQQEIWKKCHLKVPFVYGETNKVDRLLVKDKLKNKKHLVVICSRIWMEGINIPNLKRIIYAAGLKERKRVIQAMGRGLRSTSDKDAIELIDFLDPYRYLSQHAIMRIAIYNEQKWI